MIFHHTRSAVGAGGEIIGGRFGLIVPCLLICVCVKVMAEGHYDGSRNMVALLTGKRRWILSNPRSCKHMYMFPSGHPSGERCCVDTIGRVYRKQGHVELTKCPNIILGDPASVHHYLVDQGGGVMELDV